MRNSKKIRRATIVVCVLLATSLGITLLLQNFNDNIVFFFTPSELLADHTKKEYKLLRVGGVVMPNSIKQHLLNERLYTEFEITDCYHNIKVKYDKSPPSLFREKQGIVALGSFDKNNVFLARELLVKHDEKYRPPTVNWEQKQDDSFCKVEKNASN